MTEQETDRVIDRFYAVTAKKTEDTSRLTVRFWAGVVAHIFGDYTSRDSRLMLYAILLLKEDISIGQISLALCRDRSYAKKFLNYGSASERKVSMKLVNMLYNLYKHESKIHTEKLFEKIQIS